LINKNLIITEKLLYCNLRGNANPPFFEKSHIFFEKYVILLFMNSQIPHIRPANSSDLDQIYSLEQICSQNPWSLASLSEELSNPYAIFFVLEEREAAQAADSGDGYPKNQIIGFACSAQVLDEMHIHEVAIHPNHRRKGLGLLLIGRILSEAATKNIRRIYLEVRLSNHSAIRLYEKCGFTEDGVRKGYYQNGEDAVLMSASTQVSTQNTNTINQKST
jgi:ribosomal-protein-alanine N-acetyltransferase